MASRRSVPVMFALGAFALAAGVLILKSCSGSGGPVSGRVAMKHVKAWVDEIGPTPPGSEGLKKKAKYITDELTKLGLKPQAQRWTDPTEGIEFANLWVEIPGQDPDKGPILGIAAHYDTKRCEGHPEPWRNFRFVGAIDGCGGPAVLLELAKVLVQRKNVPNIWLIWFDGEESIPFDWDANRSLFGSRYFAETMSKDKQRFPNGFADRFRAFVLLDLVGSKNPKIDRDVLSHPDLLEIFKAAAEQMGEAERMFKNEPPKGITDDHAPIRDRGVAVIDLIDFAERIPPESEPGYKPDDKKQAPPPANPAYETWWHTARDTPDAMSSDSLAFFGNLVWLALPGIEQKFYAR